MYAAIEARFREALARHIERQYSEQVTVVTERPPKLDMGEVASPVCFELAKRMKRSPRALAQEISARLMPVPGVARVDVAGGGYLNAHLDRAAFFEALRTHAGKEAAAARPDSHKVILEHTQINPNKAAHVGHLRNAILGDAFVRILRHTGHRVEVQNYLDDTGVQVADVVLGFHHIKKKTPRQVLNLTRKPRFDYLCWDLYASVTKFLEEDPKHLALRAETLKEIEEGHGELAEIGRIVATATVRRHLATMDRLDIEYDLLPRESDILHLRFWETAFHRLKETGAIRHETQGKNAGCWVMDLPSEKEAEEEVAETDSKIIVRSNGTVTYVGKDIAYHLWKFGLLGKDFHYAPFYTHPSGHVAWITRSDPGDAGEGKPPAFGHGAEVINVIDSRQSYPQQVVFAGLRALGYGEQADQASHFSYEMVALTPRCAEELGYKLREEDAKKPYVEVSGRRGQGVKADDLMDRLETATRAEVDARHPETSDAERERNAHAIAMGALRYFMLKFTRSAVIAFDFKDALSFEGETGPYVQYAIVRARNIFRKLKEQKPDFAAENLAGLADARAAGAMLAAPEGNDLWDLALLAGSFGAFVEKAVGAQEPAFVAKYAFQLAQAFNLFYHKHHILTEEDPQKQAFLLLLTSLVETQLVAALGLLGIESPEEM